MGKRITVPSDIRKVKSKIGPFEIRQAITLALSCILGIGINFICKELGMSKDATGWIIFVFVAPILAFNLKYQGMVFEQFIVGLFINSISKTKRTYKPNNYYIKLNKPYKEIQYDKKGKPIKIKQTKKKQKTKYKAIY